MNRDQVITRACRDGAIAPDRDSVVPAARIEEDRSSVVDGDDVVTLARMTVPLPSTVTVSQPLPTMTSPLPLISMLSLPLPAMTVSNPNTVMLSF